MSLYTRGETHVPEKEKLCVYISPHLKRRLMHLRADTKKDMSDLAEVALKLFFDLIEAGRVSEDVLAEVEELRKLAKSGADGLAVGVVA